MKRVLLLALLAACTTRPSGVSGSGAGGSAGSTAGSGGDAGSGGAGGLDDGGSGGAAPHVCVPGDRRWCLPGHTTEAQRAVGVCRDGSQLCADGTGWGPCTGGVGPQDEPLTCDGLDQDCDGVVDGPPVLTCRWCGTGVEPCGNGLDDNCDGRVDPASQCPFTCRGDELDCCHEGPGRTPRPFSYRCADVPELPPCGSDLRPCRDLDRDIETRCVQVCSDAGCVCGEPGPDGPVESPGCGYETPCAHLGCEGRTDQPCYSGLEWHLGVGICRGGFTSCVDGAWDVCEGEQLPVNEVCGNDLDDDCDGRIDEDGGREHRRCPPRCTPGAEVCNGIDDDCDGFVDESCPASGERDCYAGPPETRRVGTCRDGRQRAEEGWWTVCSSTGPGPERCGDGLDADCDGLGGPGAPEDAGCCVASGPEACNGLDDDCDGLVDEGVVNACGTCGEPCFTEEVDEWDCVAPRSDCYNTVPDAWRGNWFEVSTDRRASVPPLDPWITLPELDRIVRWRRGEKTVVDVPVDAPRFAAVSRHHSTWIGGSALVRLDRNLEAACRLDLGARIAGLALAPFGELWVIDENGVLHEISGSGVGPAGPDGHPTCASYDLAPDDPSTRGLALGVKADGLAVTRDEVVWTASSPSARVDTRTMTWQLVEHLPSSDVALDADDNVWFAGEAIHSVKATGPYEDPEEYQRVAPAGGDAVLVDEWGGVWGAQQGGVVRVDAGTLQAEWYALPEPIGSVAQDAIGRIWAVGLTGVAHLTDAFYRPGSWGPIEVARGEATLVRGDSSGTFFYRYDTDLGSWTRRFDGGHASTRWHHVDWRQEVAPGAKLEVLARFGDAPDELETSTSVCGPYLLAPADLRACAGARGRWMAVTFQLTTGARAGEISVAWDRP